MPLILNLGQSCHDVSTMDMVVSLSPDAVGALGLALQEEIGFFLFLMCGIHFAFFTLISIW